jgi:hypothetical protein
MPKTYDELDEENQLVQYANELKQKETEEACRLLGITYLKK